MKKLFKAAASLTVGCALLSTSAFAALDGSVDGTETGATVSLTGYAEKAQSTILVLKGVEELSDDIAESAIAYINQAEATNGTITYDVKVSGDGKYTVFVGGSDQTQAKKLGSFVISSVVDVTGVTLAIKGLTADEKGNFATELTVGDTLTVDATVAPDNATDKTVTWTSSNADVAEVKGGVVTTKAAGDVVITATAGSFSKTVTIKVNEKAPALPETAAIAVRNADPYGLTGYSVVKVTGIDAGSVKVGEVDAYLADYTADGGIRQYLAIVPYTDGQEFSTEDIVWDEAGTPASIVFGDMDLDEAHIPSSQDSLTILRIAANLATTSNNMERVIADVDADGSITSQDALTVLRIAANLSTDLPEAASNNN